MHPASPLEAERAGVATAYQEVDLIPELSVAENIMLGRQPKRAGFLQWKSIRRSADEALSRLGLKLDSSLPASSYSMAIQQMVAIARALHVEAKLLILDEPTFSLDEQEVAELFALMRKLRDDGLGIVFVTPFLDQVYGDTDRITVLRNGELVGEYERPCSCPGSNSSPALWAAMLRRLPRSATPCPSAATTTPKARFS